MRILFVSPYFPPGYADGGPPRSNYALTRALIDRGHEVLVLASNGNANRNLWTKTGVDQEFDGVPVRYLRRVHRGSYQLAPSLLGTLAREASGYDVALVKGPWTFFNLATSLVLPRVKLPFVYYVSGSLSEQALSMKRRKKRIYWNLIERRNYSRAAGIIALTSEEAKQVRQTGCQVPVAVIPTGTRLAPVPAETQRKGKRRILYVGRVHPIKGLDNLVAAFALMAERVPEAELIIAGPEEDASFGGHLRGYLSARGLQERATFTGMLDTESLAHEYEQASVFALPSQSEGMSNAALEALGHGVPSVLSSGCNLPEVADYGAGLVTEPDPAALASAIETILEDPARGRQMSSQARQLVQQRFSWPLIADSTAAFCAELLSGHVVAA